MKRITILFYNSFLFEYFKHHVKVMNLNSILLQLDDKKDAIVWIF